MSSKNVKYLRREGASSQYCCVPFCKISSRFNSVVSFHSFPVDNETRKKWLHSIQRDDYKVSPKTRVCSRHFKGEDVIEPKTPTARRLLKKGAVPTLLPWNDCSTLAPKRIGMWNKESVSTVLKQGFLSTDFQQHQEHDYCSVQVDLGLEDLQKEVERLRRQVEELTSGIQRFCLGRFAASDDDIKFYTRFATYNHLMAFWRLIEPASHNMVHVTRARAVTTKSEDGAPDIASCQSLQPIDEFFLFMVYLSIGVPERDLVHRFSINQTTVSQIISSWASFLYVILGSVRIWMSKEAVKAQLPKEFQDYPDTQVVIACTQLRCQTPSRQLQEEESLCTLKGLIGMAPHGAVTFVSSLYPESLSDIELLNQSGILSLLNPEMGIMVDQGFLADYCVPCKVYRPTNLLKTDQVQTDEGEVKEIRSIVCLRVHIQRLIYRVRQHKLLDTVIPLSVTTTNQLYTVACLLINYQNGPLLKAWAKE